MDLEIVALADRGGDFVPQLLVAKHEIHKRAIGMPLRNYSLMITMRREPMDSAADMASVELVQTFNVDPDATSSTKHFCKRACIVPTANCFDLSAVVHYADFFADHVPNFQWKAQKVESRYCCSPA
jgi:hypothetical protein